MLTQLLSSSAQIAQKQPEAIALLTRLYQELFNESIQQGCGNCYQKAFFRIQKYVYLQQQNNPSNPISMPITNRQYLLKPGRSLQTSFGGDTLTNDNLTDAAAAKLLKAYPALIQHFERHPEDGLRVVSSGLPVEGVELPVTSGLRVAGSELPVEEVEFPVIPELPIDEKQKTRNPQLTTHN